MSSHQSNHISFGTDGFRGIIARDFTYDVVRKVAQGMADYISYKYMRTEKPTVVIGYDRRFMSDRFARTMAEVMAANGFAVTLSSTPLPTPAISLLTAKGYGMGVVVTASHNNHYYNGIKVKQGGRSAPPSVTGEIENYVAKAVPMKPTGAPVPLKDFRPAYVDYLNSRVPAAKVLAKLAGPVVIDFMYGVGAETAGELFNSKNVITLRDRHDPLFGGISPEPVEKNLLDLAAAVKKHKALFGVALDGDADRFALVSDKGQYMTPCQTAPLLLEYLLSKGQHKGKIVQAVSMGFLTKRIARAANLPFDEVPVGFKYIAEKMLSEDVTFGVEESGGYAWKGNLPERDGALTALFVTEMVVKTGKTISALYAEIEKKYGKSCFIRRDFPMAKAIPNKHSFAVKIKKKLSKLLLGHKIIDTNTIDGLKIILDNDWWVLMRPSGTEPLLRTYAETDSQENTKKFLDLAFKLVDHK
ncbi:MAG: phosphoglucomutase/phosphomannomutase family protein [Elusimicrobiota bacterium]|nr:phosphoglucomutase/phosphomannomutase family protein [Elusimicrobiota bacterium]